MKLAPGVTFDEAKHQYWYKGKQLSGVTGLIGKKLGLKMPQEFLSEHQEEGIHVHKAIQRWIETGDSGSVHPGVDWIVTWFAGLRDNLYSEVLVSDMKQYASSVDIIDDRGDGVLDIYDIKKGVFKRDYCTWQLSIYKYFIEVFTDYKIGKCEVLAVRDRDVYPIMPKDRAAVEKLLYGVFVQ
jgi:hypothetical protein